MHLLVYYIYFPFHEIMTSFDSFMMRRWSKLETMTHSYVQTLIYWNLLGIFTQSGTAIHSTFQSENIFTVWFWRAKATQSNDVGIRQAFDTRMVLCPNDLSRTSLPKLILSHIQFIYHADDGRHKTIAFLIAIFCIKPFRS